MRLEQRHKIEKEFHDAWAEKIVLDEIQPRLSFESPTSVENRQVLEAVGPLKGKKILDLGCGLGDAATYFALKGAWVTAVDISPGMVKVAARLARAHKVQQRVKTMRAVGEKLPFASGSFDVVYGNGVLHHLDLSVSGPEIARVLRPGGKGVFIEPLAYNPAIAVYRRLAAGVRTEAEAPLTYRHFRKLGGLFKSYRLHEMQFLTLLIFFWFFFGQRQHPSKVRYWKKIVNEGETWAPAFTRLRRMEKTLFSLFPFLKPLAWNVVAVFEK